jgi:primosomal protein N' (replication factor Y)
MEEKTKRFIKANKEIPFEQTCEKLKNSPQQKKLFLYLNDSNSELALHDTINLLGIGISSANGLLKKQFAVEISKSIKRDAYKDEFSDSNHNVDQKISLTKEQAQATKEISHSIQKKKFQPHLLQGVTGSGKTEVYFQAMEEVLSNGGGVLFLVPEVALAPQTVSRVRNRFTIQNEDVVVWHSHLSAGERLDAWRAVTSGIHELWLVPVQQFSHPFRI